MYLHHSTTTHWGFTLSPPSENVIPINRDSAEYRELLIACGVLDENDAKTPKVFSYKENGQEALVKVIGYEQDNPNILVVEFRDEFKTIVQSDVLRDMQDPMYYISDKLVIRRIPIGENQFEFEIEADPNGIANPLVRKTQPLNTSEIKKLAGHDKNPRVAILMLLQIPEDTNNILVNEWYVILPL